ncbi:hypothetical protein [Aquipuribacter hungaricus]|uniref:Uncharacterized protein n=1 Tax=Aquipuribacter hungaricus TaxID=545624 RepID=A0ABV7WEE2_9MICO
MTSQPPLSPTGLFVIAGFCLAGGIGVLLTSDMSDVGRRGIPLPVVGGLLVALAVFFAGYAVVVRRSRR